VTPPRQQAFEALMRDNRIPCALIGSVQAAKQLTMFIGDGGGTRRALVDVSIAKLKQAWQQPLRWH
jgi:hypothetical protein